MMMLKTFLGSFVAAVIIAGGSALLCGSSAVAMPLNCSGPEAPPQCHHLPTAPPATLRSSAFTPAPGINYFNVYTFANPAQHVVYPTAGLTVRLTCTNGYSHVFVLTAGHYTGTYVSGLLQTSDGQAGGTCDFETQDQFALGVDTSHVVDTKTEIHSGSTTSLIPTWDVQFT